MVDQDRIIKINIEEEMKSAYIDYSMSVIVSRALPDVRDGFKPVHRRVLFGMNELGNTSDKPYKKSARIVGEVLGKYHPHGDSSVYFAMVRMAQKWSLRYPLVDGQGNFGSVDGDSPAAMRYTEARLSKLAEEMLRDIDKDTVDFQFNFDDTLKEPTVLPTRLPNLLINGASGIAVGMATNMPPHNMSEVLDGCIAYIDCKGDIEIEGLMQYVKAPDFPTGATIYGYAGVKEAFETGRGRIILRGKAEIEVENNHEKIIISEIPYLVNKAELIKYIADLVNDKRIEGISNVNDESDRHGMRIVVDIKRDANSSVVLNKLYKMTALQSSFSVNNIALVNGRPQQLNLKQLIGLFVEHRKDVVTRRTKYELRKAEERAHILEGLIIASDNIDEVIAIIKASKSPQEAITNLMERFSLTDIQARAIVEMRLRQLTGLEQDKLRAEYEEIAKLIAHLKEILENEELLMQVIKDEFLEIKEKYGDNRKTDIIYASEEMNPEDFYADDEMIITISHMGYIKRTPLSEFRAQGRGGVGAKGSETRDEDFVEYIYPASMHATLLIFTAKGKCYWLKVYEIPEGAKNAKGRAIQNLLNIEPDDKVNAFIRVKRLKTDTEFINSHYLLFCTRKGIVKKTLLEAYSRPRQNGVNAITLHEDDGLVNVRMTNGNNEVIIANRNGRAIRFHESAVRVMGRTAAGVRGMRLDDDPLDEVVGMICVKDKEEETILVVSEQGYGKRSHIDDYRITNRGGKGVKTINITDKTGKLVTIKTVTEQNDVMIINKSGIAIRMKVVDINVIGRATQGVRLINLGKRHDEIASVCKVLSEEEEIIVEQKAEDEAISNRNSINPEAAADPNFEILQQDDEDTSEKDIDDVEDNSEE
ncbi:DNA gyrase subunit A [Parabacteroides sp. PF5-5]|uniref:DNA gyrase subunit A n=1 Tax=unclassified Parabacteroides TaxID=2649774 RepID=UPI0024766388|nr:MULTISPECIES: DNA gyrase subunit A [unclassified Parabacteroides]MDH6304069.1 DNA gyrase subunit A [Parabacteroides sp. PH5-39]MDH6315231.1 DNA gyrase subunit A [Parabacteroides sp. PF5-13]MDH6318876.1 DNA gyrase subunit A [Parabacteroides sp. PH5-13]MDH6322605.1 DNA gyrase subunit A [Parabacteroides sp. PH5-8]MDH6326243.1 DNA gyrase subunit A [Parabacteroides sp. PH5-41]